jgi:hypothetical protein
MHNQESFTSIQQNHRYIGIRRAINLLCDWPCSLIHILPTLAIHHMMFVEPKMNHHSWNWLEFMHNIAQVTQTMSLLETKPKFFFILVVITLHQTWPSYFLSMPCICKGMWVAGSTGGNSKKDISIESNWQELDFLKRYLVIIQISQFVGSMYGECEELLHTFHNKICTHKTQLGVELLCNCILTSKVVQCDVMKFIKNLLRCVHLEDTKKDCGKKNHNSPWLNVKEHYVDVHSMFTLDGWTPFVPFVIISSYNLLV